MALRNAFDLLGTESTLRKILAAVTYSRTTSDAMRVNVENQQAVTVFSANNSTAQSGAGITVGMYANNSWNTMDPREQHREATEQHFVLTRNRWTIT